jgi:hypothetical protein
MVKRGYEGGGPLYCKESLGLFRYAPLGEGLPAPKRGLGLLRQTEHVSKTQDARFTTSR